jgi:hypothetical protein
MVKRSRHNGNSVPVLLLLFSALPSVAAPNADIDIGHACAACSRRVNDSINIFHRRSIRVNQAGYLPDGPGKTAYAASSGGPFHVIDSSGRTVRTGELVKAGDYPYPVFSADGYLNSNTQDYSFASAKAPDEAIYRADFSDLKEPGRYRIAMAGAAEDTSASFLIHPAVYDKVLEKVLFFFGANRCGKTDSWLHGACHLKDGSRLGAAFSGRLAGGWHDCGDHGKYSQTTAYTALVLSLGYVIWPDKAPDLYGAGYSDKTPDGVPDLLGEAKIGIDYIFNLYAVSKELGLLDSMDMYHSIGGGEDHQYWGLPEKQDEAPPASGGADRPVAKGIGSNVAGSYAAGLALFSSAWKKRDPVYASKLEKAAIDIYDNIVLKKRGSATKIYPFYTGGGPTKDDEAMAALALWYATGESRFGFDLLQNPALGYNPLAPYNSGEFPSGLMGSSPFTHGGWTTDYEEGYTFIVYGLAKLILPDAATASRFGIPNATRDSLLTDIKANLANSIRVGSNGAEAIGTTGMHADEPYHGLFTSIDWGFNRYNLGMVTEVFMYYDLTGDKAYEGIGIDNLNYLLGANPYDISFIMGCGDRNLQHPHNRASNPEGYNQGGTSYPYTIPTGAVMGGVAPGKPLQDNWSIYTSTETCIDFAAQAVFPLLILGSGEGGTTAVGKNAARRASVAGARNHRDRHDALGRKNRKVNRSAALP